MPRLFSRGHFSLLPIYMLPSSQARNRLAITLRHLSSLDQAASNASEDQATANFDAVAIGRKYTKSYQNYCVKHKLKVVSYFHDIPLGLDLERKTATMVVEIPKWTNGKFEINMSLPGNPITQDVKKGVVRFVHNLFPYKGFLFNYGAFPQTWEDPTIMHDVAGLPGDGDPVDVCEIGTAVLHTGAVKTVKILGSLALVDDGELDWKVIVIDLEDPLAQDLSDINDVVKHSPGLLEATREWFRNYKLPEGKLQNKFAFDETYRNSQETMDVILQCHGAWLRLVRGETDAKNFSIENTTLEGSPGYVKEFGFKDLVLGNELEPDEEIPAHVNKSHYFTLRVVLPEEKTEV